MPKKMATGLTALNFLVLVAMGPQRLVSAHCNVALNGTTLQSSTSETYVAERAVDGNTNSEIFHGSCTHTDLVDNTPWWRVDLGSTFIIRQVVLYNRVGECCAWRLHDVHVGVTAEDPGSPVLGTYPLCGTHPGSVDVVAAITCPQGVPGRYVIVQLALETVDVLTLCEVEVFRSVSAQSGNSVYSEWVMSQRLVGQTTHVLYVRSGLECVTLCRGQDGCRSVNFAVGCETGMGCCELNADSCPPPQDQLIDAPGWMWLEV